ncbi:VOC family protein, partial [Zoogloea sp.]|uniref:VOC family protein n=1 Tax=Zoogloea sp. TaxID=49181 RepID=UPI002B5F14BB
APTPEMDLDMLFFPMDKDTGMNTYGSGGMLVRMEGMASGGGGTLVYFACEDCAVQAARAAEFGGRLCKEKTSIGEHGFFSLAQDSEGNMIGFHSMK